MAKVNQNKVIGGLIVAVITLIVVIVIVVLAKNIFPSNDRGTSDNGVGTNTYSYTTTTTTPTTTTTAGESTTPSGTTSQSETSQSTDASVEKHVPVYTVEGNKVIVTVGAVEHPMTEEHYIEWVSLQTKFGNQRKALSPNGKPTVCFALCEGDEVEAVFAYCNLHSLWKA